MSTERFVRYFPFSSMSQQHEGKMSKKKFSYGKVVDIPIDDDEICVYCGNKKRENPMYLLPDPWREGHVCLFAADGTSRSVPVCQIKKLPPPRLGNTHPIICKFPQRCNNHKCSFIHLVDGTNWYDLERCYPHVNYRYDQMDSREAYKVYTMYERGDANLWCTVKGKHGDLNVVGSRILKTRGSESLRPGDTVSPLHYYERRAALCHGFHCHGICVWGASCRYIHVAEELYATVNCAGGADVPRERSITSHVDGGLP